MASIEKAADKADDKATAEPVAANTGRVNAAPQTQPLRPVKVNYDQLIAAKKER